MRVKMKDRRCGLRIVIARAIASMLASRRSMVLVMDKHLVFGVKVFDGAYKL